MKLLKEGTIIQCKNSESNFLGSILIDEGKIKKILPENEDLLIYENKDDIDIVDCKGKYLMPGIIDCHVHLFMESDTWDRKSMFKENHTSQILDALRRLDQLLKSGVTYVRDCGGYKFLEIELLDKLVEEKWVLTEFLTAGELLSITGGHCWWLSNQCDGQNEFVKGVRNNIRMGADYIKIMVTGGYARQKMNVNHEILPLSPQMTREEIESVVREAHRHGKKVAAHCYGLEGVKLAVECGADSVEHGQFNDPYDKDIDNVLSLMKKQGTYVVPTLSAFYKDYNKDDVRKQYETLDISFKRYYDAGVNIALGTDSGCPFVSHGKSTFKEIKHQVDAGMSIIESIISGTKTASELLGIDDLYGTLEEGKFADILVLKENPMENIDTILNIEQIYKKGNLVK